MARLVDWDAKHTPATGTINASLTAASVAAVGHETGLPASWVLGAAVAGAAGTAVSGLTRENRLTGGSIILRSAAWLAGGGWAANALDNPWSQQSIGTLLCLSCGFGAVAGAMSRNQRRQAERKAEIQSALFRVRTGQEWVDRIARVAHVSGCQVLAVEKWTDKDGNPTGAGFDLDIQLPGNGATWKVISGFSDALAADADLPEGCSVEVKPGVSHGRCILKVSTRNALLDLIPVPLDASPMDFHEDFDIGVKRDSTTMVLNLRQNSCMMAGTKRTGKTNQLWAMMTRFVRMPNLLIWVIDFNGGNLALPWMQAWHEQGRKGRPPIDWVASNDREAELMGLAAVRIAKARKPGYQQYMRKRNTDLLPLTPEIPGILIITDEGAEIHANPKYRHVADPLKEVLRIAGAVGVNEINCFLRATADMTGDPMIKSQSTARVGMRMDSEDEISYLFGWRSGVTPQDMPDQGFGAATMNPSGPADVFRGYRVLPSDIDWFVDNTADLRSEMDEISRKAAGEAYATRWDDERAGYLWGSGEAPKTALMASTSSADDSDAPWAGRPVRPAEEVKADLRKAIEDNGGPTVEEQNEFDRVLHEAGVVDRHDPTTWPDGVRPESPAEPGGGGGDSEDDIKAVVFGIVKAMGPNGISPKEILEALERAYPGQVPARETIQRWLKADDRIYKVRHGYYAVKPDAS